MASEPTCVIIVNYNAGGVVTRSVASVLATPGLLRLIVADNASSDGSCEQLLRLQAENAGFELIQNRENLGFARAVNACAANIREPYLLILNPDCELCPGALGALLEAMQRDPQAGLASPLVEDGTGRILRGTVRSFPDPWKAMMTASGLWRLSRILPRLKGVDASSGELPRETCRVEAVSGACMLIRTGLFHELGGFDEGFGMHFEDLDLMFRLSLRKHYCLFVPAARAIHVPGTSSRSRRWWVHRQKHLGMQRFFRKHQSAGSSWLLRGMGRNRGKYAK